MPARKVQFSPGEFYHIFNRGNGKQNIFLDDRDRYRFLQAMYLSNNSNSFAGIFDLERNKSVYSLKEIKTILEDNKIAIDPLVKICADCLMLNHYHFILQEVQGNGIARFMHKFGVSYGKYFTTKHDRPGSLFQGRFKAVHAENDDQLRYLLVYINVLNPIQYIFPDLKETGISDFERAWEFANGYNWSSHQEYMGRREPVLIDRGLLGEFFLTPKSYRDFVGEILHGKEKKLWASLGDIALD